MGKEKLMRELCEAIEKDIVSMKSVTGFYIGKTDNIESCIRRHEIEDDYKRTIPVAKSDADIINEAEKYAIAYFRNKDNRLENKSEGGEGNEKADILYVSLRFVVKEMEQIEDLDINFAIRKI